MLKTNKKKAARMRSDVDEDWKALDLVVVIVSYNVRDLLIQCLRSIFRSTQNLRYKVIVVDNNSADHTVESVKSQFPEVTLVPLTTNEGFARANNIVLRRVRSSYVLLLNPDTIVQNNVFDKMKQFMDNSLNVGIVSCRLIQADGSMDLACRRSFPKLWDGFCRAVGLSNIFPKWRFFSRYNLTYLDPVQTYDVDAVNGAFMFVRVSAMKEVGYLDESYFMYIEDLDWCFRFKEAGFRIMYHPASTVIHFKGQSGKSDSDRMIRQLFYSTKLFYEKHYLRNSSALYRYSIFVSLFLWEGLTRGINVIRKNKRTQP